MYLVVHITTRQFMHFDTLWFMANYCLTNDCLFLEPYIEMCLFLTHRKGK